LIVVDFSFERGDLLGRERLDRPVRLDNDARFTWRHDGAGSFLIHNLFCFGVGRVGDLVEDIVVDKDRVLSVVPG
jgi:hypothetical protein